MLWKASGWFKVSGLCADMYENRGAAAPLRLAGRIFQARAGADFKALCLMFVAVAVLLAAPQNGLALGGNEATYTAGFRAMSLWNAQENTSLEVAIWYPAQREEARLNMQDWSLAAARNAKETPGRFPLVLISHDAGGGMLSYHDTAADLARQGFVVVAPTHRQDNFMDSSGIFKPAQILDRPGELAFVLSGIFGANSLIFIDPSRIAVVGVGSGAATALALAGGVPDFEAYRAYCAGPGAAEPYCSDLAQARFSQVASPPQGWPHWTRPRLKALVLAAPAGGMFFPRAGLGNVKLPTLIFAPETDSINNAQIHAEFIRRALPVSPEVISLDKQDSADLAAPCADNILDFDGLNCLPPDEDALEQRRIAFNIPLAAFLKTQLGGVHPAVPKPAH